VWPLSKAHQISPKSQILTSSYSSLKPTWEAVAKKLASIGIPTGAVNVVEQQTLAGYYQIQGIPTIKLFPDSLTPVDGKDGAFEKKPKDFNGPRGGKNIVDWVISQLPKVPFWREKDLEERMEEKGQKRVILFTAKSKVPPLFRSLSSSFQERGEFGVVKKEEKEACELLGVDQFPSMIVLDGEKSKKYEGEMKFEKMALWLNEILPADARNPLNPTKDPVERGEVKVKELEGDEMLEKECSSGICMMAFFDGEEGKEGYLEALAAIGKKYVRSLSAILWVDGAKHGEFVKGWDALADGYPKLMVIGRIWMVLLKVFCVTCVFFFSGEKEEVCATDRVV